MLSSTFFSIGVLMKLTNNTGLSLPIAVWLATDDYDSVPLPEYISATTLLKPIRVIVLSRRMGQANVEKSGDVSALIASRFGSAMHGGIESAWKGNVVKALMDLGYPRKVAEAIRVNPTIEEPGTIPVYLELRVQKEIAGFILGGKFDMVADGRLYDFKTTSTFTYVNNTNEEYYRLQGSIYRWLNPEKVKDDHIYIQYIFTDWSAISARGNPGYPGARILEFPVQLLSLADTENYIRRKLGKVNALASTPESQLPECTDEELWRSAPKFKYYSDPTKIGGKASKVFDDQAEANRWRAMKGKGVIKVFGGEVKACKYCPVFSSCTQKDKYLADGSLKLN